MEKKISVKMNIIYNLLNTVFTIGYPIITFIYITRVLSIESIGKINFARSFTAYFILFGTLGVNYYGVREVVRVKSNKKELSKLFWEIFFINLTTSLVSFVVMVISILYIKKLFIYKELLLINSSIVILGSLTCEWMLVALENFKFISVRSIFIKILSFALIFLFVRKEQDYLLYLILVLFASYGGVIFNYLFIFQEKLIEKFDLKYFTPQKHIKPILTLFAMYISIELYTALDVVMLGLLKSSRSVGLYTVAIKIPRLINSLIVAIGVVLVPKLIQYYENDKEKFLSLLKKAILIVIILTIPCFVGVFLEVDAIVVLLSGNRYIEAVKTTRILSLLILIIPITVLFNNQVFIPMRKEKFVLIGTIIGAIVNICLNFNLIPKYGENGAAIASVVAELCVLFVCLLFVRRKIGKLGILKKYVLQWTKGIILIVIIILINLFFKNLYLKLVISICVSVPFYFVICKKDIKDILEKFE